MIGAKCLIHLLILSGPGCALACAQDARQDDPKQIVQQAVQTELAADRDDHSRWLYFEVDRKPKNSVTQWVAETPHGDLDRVLEENSQKASFEF